MPTPTYIDSCGSATISTEWIDDTLGGCGISGTPPGFNIRSQCYSAVTSGIGDPAFFFKYGVLADAGRRFNIYVKLSELPDSNSNMFQFLQSDHTTEVFRIAVGTGGKLQLRNSGLIGTSTIALTPGAWYRICVSYTITSTTVNEFRIYVATAQQGFPRLEISATNATLTATGSSTLKFGIGTGVNHTALFAHIYVDDGTDLADLGNIWITPKFFASDIGGVSNNGVAIGSDPGAGNHYQSISERPVSEANGWALTSGHLEVYNLQPITAGDYDISNEALVARCAWAWADMSAGGTVSLVDNGNNHNVAPPTTPSLCTYMTEDTSYPTGTGGMWHSVAGQTLNFYEGGALIAYRPRRKWLL